MSSPEDSNTWKPVPVTTTEGLKDFLETIKRLRTIVSDLQGLIVELERLAGITDIKTPPPELQKLLRLLWIVKLRDGVVSKDELYKLAEKVGYDTRGLGGVYRAGYIEEIAGNQVALTKKGEKLVKDYEDWLKYQNNI